MRKPIRIVLWMLLALLVLATGAALVFAATFDPNRYKPQVAAAVKRATGRDLSLNGNVSLAFGLSPTFIARDVALANVAGGSRPEMITLGQLEARISLLGLLHRRLEIERLILIKPDILLESNAAGEPNWRFSPAVPSESLPQPAPANASRAPPPDITLRHLLIQEGRVTYRAGGQERVLTLARFEARAPSRDAMTEIGLQAAYNGAAFTVDGTVGPLGALQTPDADAPWPVRLTVGAGEARATVAGTLREPLRAQGYDLAIDAGAPDLQAFQPFYPPLRLPKLRDITASAHVTEAASRPSVSALKLHAGASDLSAVAPGLQLTALDVDAPALDQPAKVTATGLFANAPLSLAATLGAPAMLLAGAPGPFPVEATATAAGARLIAKGTVAQPLALTGVDIGMDAQIPDLAALSPLARRPLPALENVAFQTVLRDAGGGFAHGLTLKGARLVTPQGDLAGDLTLGSVPRPFVRGSLSSTRLDVDAVEAALARPPAPSPAAAPQAATAPPPAAPPQPAPAPVAAPAGGRWVIPDTPLPFAPLLAADADLDFKAGTVVARGTPYRDVSGHLALNGGKLRLDPFAAELPGGPMTLTASADATQPKPPVALTFRTPGLALASLLAAFRLPADANGSVEVDLDVRGAGHSPHEIASTADGHLGLASQGVKIGNRVLAETIGPLLRDANLPGIADLAGASDVRCFATRLDAKDGHATLRAFVLDTSLLLLEGSGSINLADEALALQLRPLLRTGGTGVIVPLRVGGTLRAPKASVDATGVVGEAARQAEAAGARSNPALGIIIGALGADRTVAGSGGRDNCAAALALARGGKAGPVPPTAPAATAPAPAPPSPQAPPRTPKPADLLRQFLR
ncbi:MAG: AsmA family protein [Acetobacteraceae bacterium]|nr:AsmA family protein [Acetobacteraceae bacterium]